MPKSAKENFKILSLILLGLVIIFIGIIMLFSGNDMNPYTSLDLGPSLQLKISNTQQLLLGGICFVSVIVLFGKRNQPH
jgi:amino acid transporter